VREIPNQCQSVGEPDASKGARPVREGVVGNVLSQGTEWDPLGKP